MGEMDHRESVWMGEMDWIGLGYGVHNNKP